MIIAYIGDIGSGKTLSMVRYAFKCYQSGRTIFSNFHLDFPPVPKGYNGIRGTVQLLDSQFFKNYAESKFSVNNALVMVDECHVFFDSRNAMLKRNKMFSRFITQSRKRDVDFAYSTQDKSPEAFLISGQVELRLRKLTDRIVMCESVPHQGKKYIKQTICDRYGTIISTSVFCANDYYTMYDTNEIIDFEDI